MNGKSGLRACVWLCLLGASALHACGGTASNHAGPDNDSCQVDSDCGVGKRCSDAVCVEDIFGQAGADGEQAGAPGQPSPTGGAGGSDGADAGGTAGAAGEPHAECEPGARVCDGPSVKVCGNDATFVIGATCSLSQICSDGECLDIDCTPGSVFCGEGQILGCNEDGTSSDVVEKCALNQYCVEQGHTAECSDTVCFPDSALCLGDVATVCKADGSGAEPGGQNCASTGQLCQDGVCSDQTCEPGLKLCEHGDVYICVGGGAKAVLFTDCNADEVCDPELAACRKSICEPGKLGCDEKRVVTCNDLGTGWDQSGTDCASSSQICVAGSCATQTCVPSSTFCKNGNVFSCDDSGVSSVLSEQCNPASYHCAPYYYANTAHCAYNSCTPGSAICNGNTLTKCNADGSGYEPGGTDCGTDQVCSGSSCTPKICQPYVNFCKDGDVHYCNYSGLSSYLERDCGADARCLDTDAGVGCVPYDCTPGFKACIGNQVGTCADDGAALASVKQDCSATGDVCTSASACDARAIDTLGSTDELDSYVENIAIGDAVDVHSNRELTELEANIVLAGSRDLRWVIFELVGNYYVVRYDKLVENQTGSGYFSSGPISYALKAGRRYLLGVAVEGGGFVPYYDTVPWQPQISFGKLVGGLASQYSASIYAAYLDTGRTFTIRTTTSLP